MTTTPHGQVPEALRLAEEITNLECSSEAAAKTIAAAADELCRLHVENASLRASPAASPTPPAEQAPERSPLGAPAGHSGVNNTPQLLPCPFCGAPASGYAIEPHSHSTAILRLVPELPDHPGSYVIEGQCACGSGLIGANESEVTARWNRRTPQQEAQEPVAYVHVPHSTVEGKVRPVVSFEKYQQDYADGIYSTRIPLYTAPQPAPAPLSEREAFEAWIEKDGGDLGTFGTPPNMHYRNSSVNNAWVAWKARAALAAQGGK